MPTNEPSNQDYCSEECWEDILIGWKSFSCVWLSVTPWTIAYRATLSTGFSRQGYWSGLPFPSPGDLPDPGIKPRSPTLQAGRDFTIWASREALGRCRWEAIAYDLPRLLPPSQKRKWPRKVPKGCSQGTPCPHGPYSFCVLQAKAKAELRKRAYEVKVCNG